MKIERVWLTPKDALRMLEGNTHNRNQKQNIIAQILQAINEGRWNEYTGEAVKITEDGTVLDGQNRLIALSRATVEGIYVWLATGVPHEAQEFMDQGAPRSLADMIKLRHPDVQGLQVVASMTGWLTVMPRFEAYPSFLTRLRVTTPVYQRLDVFEKDADRIVVAALEGKKFNSAVSMVAPTPVAFVWYQIEQVEPGIAGIFFGAMRHLAFKEDDPRRATYEALQRVYQNPDISSQSAETAIIYMTILTKGYNAWATGRAISSIRWRDKGRVLEPEHPLTVVDSVRETF
jgi:hypothetical protein